MALWRKALQADYVDEHYQPLLSRTQAALLADAMAERLSRRSGRCSRDSGTGRICAVIIRVP
jgi:hypothetical protein